MNWKLPVLNFKELTLETAVVSDSSQVTVSQVLENTEKVTVVYCQRISEVQQYTSGRSGANILNADELHLFNWTFFSHSLEPVVTETTSVFLKCTSQFETTFFFAKDRSGDSERVNLRCGVDW